MDTEISIIISLTLYKLTSLLVGLASIYMGYLLFTKGIWGQAGALTAIFKNNKLILKNAAPGTFFALFGAVIISITLWIGVEFEKYKVPADDIQTNQTTNGNTEVDLPSKPPKWKEEQ